jgi:hypothetical protein
MLQTAKGVTECYFLLLTCVLRKSGGGHFFCRFFDWIRFLKFHREFNASGVQKRHKNICQKAHGNLKRQKVAFGIWKSEMPCVIFGIGTRDKGRLGGLFESDRATYIWRMATKRGRLIALRLDQGQCEHGRC